MNANRCRLCLGHTTQYINIFQKDSFSEMIHILSGIKVDPEDGLPSIACLQCHQEVKSAMLTRYQIINSNKTLCEELQFSAHPDIKIDYDDEPIGSDCEVDNSFDMIEVETELTEEECCEDNRNSPINAIKFKRKPLGDKVDRKKRKPAKVQFTLSVEHEKFLKGIKRNDRVACPDCGKVLFGVNMKNHLYTHKYDPVICDMCGKTSKNAQALQDHINYYHKTTIDRFVCDKCGRCFRVRCALEKHELKEHGSGEKSCECSICGKKFFEQAQLKNHIKITHNKIKSYKCEHCGKDFGRRTQFVTHQLVHSKVNRYHCQVCGKGFKIKQTMQTHLKGVHGIEEEKTIFCDICHKGFSSQNGLRAHINSRVHGLEKCEHCSEYITLEFKRVHLKEMHGLKAGTSKLTEVDREIKILKVVDHINIIYLDRVYESPKKIYMVLEYCKEELFHVYCEKRPFSEKVSKKVILQLSDAIAYLHANDIVHRDVKMENILLADPPTQDKEEYFIKLTDFGLSIVKSGVGVKSLMSDYCGTITYMPPEILQMKTYSELCDVWAIGIILYMMLYGRNPFHAKTDDALMQKICYEEPDYDNEGISPEAIELLTSVLKKDPVQRMTALQLKNNDWLNNRRSKGNRGKDQNIVDMMKQFRHENAPAPSRARGLVSDSLEHRGRRSVINGTFQCKINIEK